MIKLIETQSSLEFFLSSGVALLGAMIWCFVRQKSQVDFEEKEKYLFIWFFLLAFIGPDLVRFLKSSWIDLHTCFVFYLSVSVSLVFLHLETLDIQGKSFWVFSFLALFSHILIDQIFLP